MRKPKVNMYFILEKFKVWI